MGIEKDKSLLTAATELRRHAEERLRANTAELHSLLNQEDIQRLIHELEIHQIELEMQNAELRQAQVEAEAALEKYADLYDFAPVGYVTLDREGAIQSVNLAGASLIGVERSRLLGRCFGLFVAEEARLFFSDFLDKVFTNPAKEACELALLKEGISPPFVRIEGVADASGQECHIALIDITERKRAEDGLRKSHNELELRVDKRTGELREAEQGLREINETLERRVAERTAELQAANSKLLYSRRAALNMMEDADIARKRAEEASLELQREATERRQAEEELRKSRERLDLALASSRMATFDWDIVTNKRTWSDGVHSLLGTKPETFTGTSEEFFQIIHPEDRSFVQASLVRALETTGVYETEYRAVWPDGSIHHIIARGKVQCDDSGQAVLMTGVCWDITERKRAEERLHAQARTLKALNSGSQALLHATDELSLLQAVCRTVAEDCGHVLVWIGFAEEDEEKSVRPVASSGFDEGYLETLGITWADTERGRGPTGTSIRTGKPCGCADMLSDPSFEPWRAEAIKRGYGSSLVLPLMSDGKAFGALSIYSPKPYAFSEEEVDMLMQLVDELAYGIRTVRLRIAHDQVEESLRHNESILAQAGQMANLGVWEIEVSNFEDFDTNLLRWSDEVYRIFGYRPGEVEVTNALFFERIHPDDRQMIKDTVKQAIALKKPYSFEHRIIRPDDSERIVYEHAEITFDNLDRPVHFLGAVQDITERKRAEENLRQARDEWELTFNSVPDLIAIIDDRHRVVRVNKAMAERLGREPGECVGMPCYEAVHGANLPPDFCPHSRTMGDGGEHNVELHEERLGGDYLVTTTPLLDSHGRMTGTVHVARDITERKQAEAALKRSYDEMEKRVEERTAELRDKDKILLLQSRQAAMGEMIGNIAHQWRQPLNALGLTIQRQLLFYDLGEFTRESLAKDVGISMELIQHMSKTIDDFSNYFKPNKDMVEFNVREALENALSLLEGSLQNPRISVEIAAKDDLVICGYQNEFAQALLNIIINARDALIEREIGDPRVTVTIFSEDGGAVLTIADNAGGISGKIIGKIFDPYFTTKGPQHGTGVGLFMSKAIIEKNMGGKLSVRNSGNGAEFRIEVNNGVQI